MEIKDFTTRVKNIIRKSDAIIMLVDSRFPDNTGMPAITKMIKRSKKYLINVATKSDLISPHKRQKLKEKGLILTSAKQRFGKEELMIKLNNLAENKKKKMFVAVIGYPDVGKSSLINYLVGRKRVKTSPIAHTTKGQQYIKLNDMITLVDTPGIFEDKSLTSLGVKGGISPEQLSDATPVVLKIVKFLIKKGELERLKYYDFNIDICGIAHDTKNINNIVEELLLHVAKKRNLKLKGGGYNTNEAAKIIMRDFQRGRW
ncbi:50S ribosome-binding GTPase [Candidatus Micrarchaeota archaeon]|nr:50S ribosome-binding GTPase [Candidatus Micrarchaeota archaeon]